MMMRIGWCQHCKRTLRNEDTFNWVKCRKTGYNDLCCDRCLDFLYEYSPNGDCIIRRD